MTVPIPNGKYLMHDARRGGYKYIKKIKTPYGYRYFYSQEALRKYMEGLNENGVYRKGREKAIEEADELSRKLELNKYQLDRRRNLLSGDQSIRKKQKDTDKESRKDIIWRQRDVEIHRKNRKKEDRGRRIRKNVGQFTRNNKQIYDANRQQLSGDQSLRKKGKGRQAVETHRKRRNSEIKRNYMYKSLSKKYGPIGYQ